MIVDLFLLSLLIVSQEGEQEDVTANLNASDGSPLHGTVMRQFHNNNPVL